MSGWCPLPLLCRCVPKRCLPDGKSESLELKKLEKACLEHMIRLGESEASRSAKRDVEKAKAENNRMKQELEKAKAEIANSPRSSACVVS